MPRCWNDVSKAERANKRVQDKKTDTDKKSAPSDALSNRIAQFEDRKVAQQQASNRAQMPTQGLALAGRVAVELVAGIAVGGFLGWMLDSWLETTPLFMVVLFFIGAAAGMMNVWRAATGRGLATGFFEEQADSDDEQRKDRSG